MKRSPLVLVGLLLAAAVAGTLFGARWSRWRLEQSLSRFLKIPVAIERVQLSPRRLILHGVSLSAQGAGALAPLKIQTLQMEGAPWKNERVQPVTLTGLNLSVAGVPLLLGGHVEVSGRLPRPVVFGWLEGADGRRRHFVAQLDVSGETLQLERMEIQGGWNVRGSLNLSSPRNGELSGAGPDERFHLQVKPLPGHGTAAILSIQRAGLPPQEISAEWSIQRSRLHLESRFFNDQARLSARIGLNPPHPTDLRLELKELDLAELAGWFPAGGNAEPPSGRLQGEVTLSGPISRPASSGRLSGHDGRLGTTDFKWLSFNFRGTGPILQLEDSHLVTRQAGALRMEGLLDLRKIGRQDFARGIRTASADRAIRETGWPVSLTPGSAGLKLGRGDPEGVGLRADLDQEGEFIGVEHRKEF